MAKIESFECSRCGEKFAPEGPRNVCPKCAGPLYVRYDLKALAKSFKRESLAGREHTMWRYAEVLPPAVPVSLHEGMTPLIPSRVTSGVFIKEEGVNPTGSFKARGMSAAVTMARHYGLRKLAAPSAGNAASALAAYAAAASLEAHIFMPRDVPMANRVECESYGARVTLVDGLISDCGRIVAERKDSEGWFDVSTMKEPFRVEGKKTMGYEIAEQMGWTLPDALIYPTGGGVGLIGMWKAFDEMEALGWIGAKRPKMIGVQAAGCAPIVKAWEAGAQTSEACVNATTLAAGLRVPKAYGDFIILDILRQSKGTAVSATDTEIMQALRDWASQEGIFAAPEGAASLAAYRKLRATGFLKESDSVVLFNTGSGLKYIDVIASYFGWDRPPLPPTRNIGGIIQPY